MNKGLLIFIGECFRTGGQGSRNCDLPESIEPQKNASLSHINFINKIKKKYEIDIDIAINSYKTSNQELLLSWYLNKNIIFSQFNEQLLSQQGLINNALSNEQLSNLSIYEFIFICRIDLFLKDLLFDLFDPYSQKLIFPSVCWFKDSVYKNMPRVNDTMLFIPKNMFNADFIINKKVSLIHKSWFIYVNDYKLNFDDLSVYLDTYHDSDSAKDFNPLYYIVSREESTVWHSMAYILDKNTMQSNKYNNIRHNFEINTNQYNNLTLYCTEHNSSYILLNNNNITFIKKIKKPSTFCWIGYIIKHPGVYDITFEICSSININFDFIKLHKPVKFYKTEYIYANINTKIKLTINTSIADDLLCFIFDDLDSDINIVYNNIKIIPNYDIISYSKKFHIWHHNWNDPRNLSFMYDPVVKSIIHILKEQYPLVEFNYKVNCYDWHIINEYDTLIWIGPFMCPEFNLLKNKNIYTIYYNTEPDINNPDSNEIWTYSKIIFNEYVKNNITQIIKYFPIVCSKNIPFVPYISSKNTAKLLFFGKFEYRQDKVNYLFKNSLLKNNLIEVYNTWDDMSFNSIIENSKNIFLNLTKSLHINALPSVRINKLLSHKCIIISEHVNIVDEELYDGMVYFCNLNEIANIYSNFLQNTPMQLQELSNNIYTKFYNKFNCKNAVELIIRK